MCVVAWHEIVLRNVLNLRLIGTSMPCVLCPVSFVPDCHRHRGCYLYVYSVVTMCTSMSNTGVLLGVLVDIEISSHFLFDWKNEWEKIIIIGFMEKHHNLRDVTINESASGFS